ncbi:MAG: hypothetical protein O3B22_01180 [Proteobacteria bacterium]|jgi:hypothetical protein|nr:hypothetical protein [Pseudomonadota bacterium]MDA0951053.1 hypothetical protein [Pseudomonadota bacterium]MDA1069780.1 hypothetical protein [Pseudomonadota bacterium]
MPVYVVECADERVFTIDAESPEEAIEALSRTRHVAPSALRIVPEPAHEREWGIPALLVGLGLLGALCLALAL